jgi:hypothetical protein
MATAPVPSARPARVDLLGVYLNDHLAGATAGIGLARRMAASAEPGSERAKLLQRLAKELGSDRAALVTMMDALDVSVRGHKVFGAWAGTQASRLKLNGRLFFRSPLSDLEETEVLRLDVSGKAAGWRTLRTLAETDNRLDATRLDELLRRASRQEDELENLQVNTAGMFLDERNR